MSDDKYRVRKPPLDSARIRRAVGRLTGELESCPKGPVKPSFVQFLDPISNIQHIGLKWIEYIQPYPISNIQAKFTMFFQQVINSSLSCLSFRSRHSMGADERPSPRVAVNCPTKGAKYIQGSDLVGQNRKKGQVRAVRAEGLC